MTARNAIYATLIIIVMVGLLILRSLVPIIPEGKLEQTYLQRNDVRGIEIVFNDLPWTLNFDQQQEMIDLVNRCIPIGKLRDTVAEYPGLGKIVIYVFGEPPIILTPVDFGLNEFYFRSTKWNPSGYIMDNSAGQMLHLVESSHDS